jgi:hypothetical protein
MCDERRELSSSSLFFLGEIEIVRKIVLQASPGKYELRPAVKKLYHLRPKETASNVLVASRG